VHSPGNQVRPGTEQPDSEFRVPWESGTENSVGTFLGLRATIGGPPTSNIEDNVGMMSWTNEFRSHTCWVYTYLTVP